MVKNIVFFLLASCTLIANESSIDRLMEGNKRFVNDKLKHPNRSAERREALSASQAPFAVILGCSDSRVAPEIVFDQGVGDLFVVRVAGNVAGSTGLASIEFAVTQLNSSVILVLGHENCGAVNAVIHGKTKDIEPIAELIEPAITDEKRKKAHNLLEASIKANARRMRDLLLKNPVLQKFVSEKKLEIYAGYYNLTSGAVELLKD